VGSNPKDVGAKLVAKRCFTEYEPGDGTEIKGDAVDRIGALSGVGIITARANITAGQGAANTGKLKIDVQHSSTTTDGDFTSLSDKEVDFIASATGVADLFLALPVDLSGAKKYVRVVGTLTSNDLTFTTTDEHIMSGALVLGGLAEKPDDAYDSDGYADHDLADITA